MTLKKLIKLYKERTKTYETISLSQVIFELRYVKSIGKEQKEVKYELLY